MSRSRAVKHRIEEVNTLMIDREDRRIRRESDEGRAVRDFPPSDPLKFPWFAIGGELHPMPKDGLFP